MSLWTHFISLYIYTNFEQLVKQKALFLLRKLSDTFRNKKGFFSYSHYEVKFFTHRFAKL